MEFKLRSKLTSVFSVYCLLLQVFCMTIASAQRADQQEDFENEDKSTPQVCMDEFAEHQEAFFIQLKHAISSGNEDDLVDTIIQFADTGGLSEETFIRAFSFLVASESIAAREKLAEYFTKPMIAKLSEQDSKQLCRHLLEAHSKKYNMDIDLLQKAQNVREAFFRLLLQCLRNCTHENLATAVLLVKIDKNFVGPQLLATLINQRSPEQIHSILTVFYPNELISQDVLNYLSEPAKQILADIDFNMMIDQITPVVENEAEHLDFNEPTERLLDANDLYSMIGMIIDPRPLAEQVIADAKKSPKAMIEACMEAVDHVDHMVFNLLLHEVSKMLEPSQILYILDYAASSGVPLFVNMVSQIFPDFDLMPYFSTRSKSFMLSINEKTDQLAQSVASSYWSKLSKEEKLTMLEGQSYQQVFEQLLNGLRSFIALEDFPPYSRHDLNTLANHLMEQINANKLGYRQPLNHQQVFDLCYAWGQKLKKYGLVASMKTQNPYY